MKYIFFAVGILFLFFIIKKVNTGFTGRSNTILLIASIFVAGVVVITDGILAMWQSITIGIALGLLSFIILRSRLVSPEEEEPVVEEGQESGQNTDIEKEISGQDREDVQENGFLQDQAGIVEKSPAVTTLQLDERNEEEVIQSRSNDTSSAIEAEQRSRVSEDQRKTPSLTPTEDGAGLEDELLAARPRVIEEREEQTSSEVDRYPESRKLDLEALIEMDDREQDSNTEKRDKKAMKRIDDLDDYEIPEVDFEDSSKDKES